MVEEEDASEIESDGREEHQMKEVEELDQLQVANKFHELRSTRQSYLVKVSNFIVLVV